MPTCYAQPLLGDAIVLWRVCAFWSNGLRERLVLILPFSVYLASIGTTPQ